jgi:D-alanine-D-alanine ligase
MSPTTVLVLMGGPDAEHQVSLMSGREVAQALRRLDRYHVVEAVIDTPTATQLDALEGDVVFPMLHGRWGEGGALQTELERLGRPYVGSGPEASALAMDKLKTKALMLEHDVTTPEAEALNSGDQHTLSHPLVLKPIDDGSSVDMRICRTESEVHAAREELHAKRGRIMAERYIEGRELTVGIIGNEALPVIEIVPAGTCYDYDAKYLRDDTTYVIDPDLPVAVEYCAELALRVFDRIGCLDLARVDFMLDNVGLWFLEINTIPGFTTHSLLPMAAQHRGIQMPELCASLVEAAARRGQTSTASSAACRPVD